MKLSRSARFRLGASLLIGSALVACALDPLNPQPLPPGPPEASFGADAGGRTQDAGRKTDNQNADDDDDTTTNPGADAAALPPANAGPDAGDAGTDAGDGGRDAGPDADAAQTP